MRKKSKKKKLSLKKPVSSRDRQVEIIIFLVIATIVIFGLVTAYLFFRESEGVKD